jgi:uncharacterized protein YnzC (UPF0291/DUF896 family)
MATSNRKPRQPKVYPDEVKITGEIDAINDKAKKDKDRDLTDSEKKRVGELRKSLGSLRFVRLAKQRAGKAVAAIRNVAKLGGNTYTRNPEQVTKIVAALNAEVKAVADALNATTKQKESFNLDI